MKLFLVSILLALALLSCAPAAEPTTTTTSNTPSVLFVPMVPVGRLENRKTSSVGGYAEVIALGNATHRIYVKLGNLPPESKRAGSVVSGTCDRYGNTAIVRLEPIRADRDGVGASVGDTPRLAASNVTRMAILYYQRDADDAAGIGDPVSCGDFVLKGGK